MQSPLRLERLFFKKKAAAKDLFSNTPARLPLFQKAFFLSSLGILWGSGVAWALCEYVLPAMAKGSEGSFDSPKALLLALHGFGAMVILLVLGSLLPTHILWGWRVKRSLVSGLIFCGLLGFLGLTGYALYYLGSEQWRRLVGWAHLLVGLPLPLLFAWHAWKRS
jgi:hypothetical protein